MGGRLIPLFPAPAKVVWHVYSPVIIDGYMDQKITDPLKKTQSMLNASASGLDRSPVSNRSFLMQSILQKFIFMQFNKRTALAGFRSLEKGNSGTYTRLSGLPSLRGKKTSAV
jgi:hypothetical protein